MKAGSEGWGMGNESEDGLQQSWPTKEIIIVQLVMGPAQSDFGFFGGRVREIRITYFLSIGNCPFKVFSPIYYKLEGVYIKGILLGQVGFFHFSVFAISSKILLFLQMVGNKQATLKVKNKNEEQKQNKTLQSSV